MINFHSLIIISLLSNFIFSIPLERRAIDANLLATFNLYEQYAAAAYCPTNNNSPNTKIVCSSGNCPLVEAANTDTVIEFQDSAGTDATGYLATDTTNNLIVLSFRGSESIRNYFTDLSFSLVSTDVCNGCLGLAGFWLSWLEVRDNVKAAVAIVAAANPSFKIVATGHSLGGAIATFAAAELRNAGYTVDLVSFGAPRVGDRTTARHITNQNKGANYRITHKNDPAPRLPPESFGYLHTSPEYYISNDNNQPVTTKDIRVCSGLGNSQCNAAWLIFDLYAHAWYFNEISACYPGDTIEV
ncbi:alpha/beta-hydrolase [Tothia fuscella]|uniref:Alpha/beta-hydrolase n=1 Tax=Tothia fuscella TaxID=1048955 RepID=A0A9P4U1D1_9PEZI|nr:alpha/beta-hydrolase [Tothia fuscella]